MIPTLLPADYVDTLVYSGDVPTFPKHGDIDLVDCIECLVEQTEDDTSEWELALTYPVGGQGFSDLALDKIILAKANNHQDPQAFRIYGIEKNLTKTVTVKAQHISYDMINVPVKPFKANSAAEAVSGLRTNTIYGNNWKAHHFYFSTDIISTEKFEPDTPKSMRAMLLDGDDSIKGTYGGDLVFDNYNVQLLQVGGEDRDVTLYYGVDLIDMEQEHNNSEMITGILPYYRRLKSDEQYETDPIIYGDVCYGPGTYVIQKIEPVDLSEHFPNSVPTVAQITAKGEEWVAEEEIGEPEVSLTVTYANIGQDIRILDAVRVKFVKMGVDVTAKVVKYRYNTLLERCEEIEVGHAKDSRYFNLMDASKLRKGLIPPERVANESITESKLASGSVGKGKIAREAVGKYNIERYSIDHELMSRKGDSGGAAIQSDNIEDGAVLTDKLANKAVKTAKIDDSAITNAKIVDSAVTTGKINNTAVSKNKLSVSLSDNIDSINADLATFNQMIAGQIQVHALDAGVMTFHNAIYFGSRKFSNTTTVIDTNGNSKTVICQ